MPHLQLQRRIEQHQKTTRRLHRRRVSLRREKLRLVRSKHRQRGMRRDKQVKSLNAASIQQTLGQLKRNA